MKVKNWMAKDLVTVKPNTKLSDAIEIMHKHSIRHLPVIEDGEMVGFVTESNLRQYMIPSAVKEIRMKDVMILNPITIDANASIDSAAKRIYEYKIGGLPVLDRRKLVGIITTTDILGAFIELMGLLKESYRLDISLAHGDIDEVLGLIKTHGGKVISVGVDAKNSRKRLYYIRMEKTELDPIVNAIEELGHKVVSVVG